VYSLIFGSKLESAKDFKRWVTSDVLPVIRKHGGYIAAKADETPEDIMARALVVAQATLERRAQLIQMLEGEKDLLTAENKKLAPKAEYTDKVLQSTNTYTMTQIAKELGLTSAISLEKKLHDAGIIFKQSGQWMLYAKYQGEGYTQARTHLFTRSDGTPDSNTITVWTEKGRAFIHQMLAQKGGKK
jgi:phage antirepressor YoqD-like protein